MITPDVARLIHEEVEKYLQIFFNGRTVNSTRTTEGVSNMLPGQDVVPKRPIMRPYGLTSRATDGTGNTVARIGNHPWGVVVLGHLDQNQPDCQTGETVLYNAFGNKVSLKSSEVLIETSGGTSVSLTDGQVTVTSGGTTITLNGSDITIQGTNVTISGSGDVKLGSDAAGNPTVLGTELKQLFVDTFTWLQSHTHLINALPGPSPLPTQPPTQAAQIATIQASYIDNDAIVSDHVFVEK
jgi:phage gp45-like